MAQQRRDVLLVEFDPPLGQRDPLALHQGQNGEQQRVGRELAHARVAAQGLQQLRSFSFGVLAHRVAFPLHGALQGVGPALDEVGDVVVVEVDQGALAQAVDHGPHVPVAHDAAGEQELVTLLPVQREELLHPLDHQITLS